MSHVTIFKKTMSHVTKPSKGLRRIVNFRGLRQYNSSYFMCIEV